MSKLHVWLEGTNPADTLIQTYSLQIVRKYIC